MSKRREVIRFKRTSFRDFLSLLLKFRSKQYELSIDKAPAHKVKASI